MLVLSRKVNQSIVIGDGIRITVASIRGHHVRIALQAPEDVPIFREELLGGAGTDSAGPPSARLARKAEPGRVSM